MCRVWAWQSKSRWYQSDAFVVEELRDLGVPVAGNFEGGCGREVVLLVVLADDVGMVVHGVGPVVDLAISGVESARREIGRQGSASLR